MADGDVAQLGERCPYKAEVVGSSPAVPTTAKPLLDGGFPQSTSTESVAQVGVIGR